MSSGINLQTASKKEIFEVMHSNSVMLESFVNAFIDSDKPIITKIDGLCLGIMCTTQALCDYNYATKSASFQTPFTKIAQSPEGCSSYLFPQIFGQKLSREILLENQKFDSQLALKCGFLSGVFEDKREMDEFVDKKLENLGRLPQRSYLSSLKLIKEKDRKILREVNRRECENLVERWTDFEELGPFLKAFFAPKN